MIRPSFWMRWLKTCNPICNVHKVSSYTLSETDESSNEGIQPGKKDYFATTLHTTVHPSGQVAHSYLRDSFKMATFGTVGRQDSTTFDCEAGLLIGYNCQQALLPREILTGEENHPYAQRTDLGWSIVSCSNPARDYCDTIGTSHRIAVRQVTPTVQPSIELKKEVYFVCRTQVKEINPTDVLKALEYDFTDHATDDNSVSQEDLLFLSQVKEGMCQKEDSHYELPLPFRSDKPHLPDNKQCAVHRLASLERRLRKNDQYYKDYVHFMNDIITRGDAERVPQPELDNQPA